MGDPTVVQQVIEALAEADGVDALALDRPLYEVIETDALEALARHDGEWLLQFSVDGHLVTVEDDDGITVEVT